MQRGEQIVEGKEAEIVGKGTQGGGGAEAERVARPRSEGHAGEAPREAGIDRPQKIGAEAVVAAQGGGVTQAKGTIRVVAEAQGG